MKSIIFAALLAFVAVPAIADDAYPAERFGKWTVEGRPGGCMARVAIGNGEVSVWAALIFYEQHLSGDTTYTLSVSDQLIPGPATPPQYDSPPTKKVGHLQEPREFGWFVIRSTRFATGVVDAGAGWIF